MCKSRRFSKLFKTLAPIFFLFFGAYQSQAQTAETFDINRYSTAGEGWFETFYIEDTQTLQSALDAGTVSAEMDVLVTETAVGKLALLKDQMAYHHIAQGTADGKDWMATF
jgi:hypothetical protein